MSYGRKGGYLFVREGRKDEHLHYLTLGCELAPLMWRASPNRSGLFLLSFCFYFLLLVLLSWLALGVHQGHQRSSKSSLCVVKSSLCVLSSGQGVFIVVKVIKLLGSSQAWSPGQGHQVVRKC